MTSGYPALVHWYAVSEDVGAAVNSVRDGLPPCDPNPINRASRAEDRGMAGEIFGSYRGAASSADLLEMACHSLVAD